MKKDLLRFGIVALLLIPCNMVRAQEANKQETIDDMTYNIGIAQTQGLKEYLVNTLHVDLDFFSEFVKGLKDGAAQANDKEKNAYFAGIQIGNQIAQRMVPGINKEVFGDSINIRIPLDVFMKGFMFGLDASAEDLAAANEKAKDLLQKVKENEMLAKYTDNKVAGEKYLAANKKKSGVKQLPSGLQYKVIKKGNGKIPGVNDVVKVHYEGRLIDGEVFDSSYERGEPSSFSPNQVIKGWEEALTNMPVGSTWEVYIPNELAYGEREQGVIKPFSVLIFKIELLSIEKEELKY